MEEKKESKTANPAEWTKRHAKRWFKTAEGTDWHTCDGEECGSTFKCDDVWGTCRCRSALIKNDDESLELYIFCSEECEEATTGDDEEEEVD